jgi:hypothetical protein
MRHYFRMRPLSASFHSFGDGECASGDAAMLARTVDLERTEWQGEWRTVNVDRRQSDQPTLFSSWLAIVNSRVRAFAILRPLARRDEKHSCACAHLPGVPAAFRHDHHVPGGIEFNRLLSFGRANQ